MQFLNRIRNTGEIRITYSLHRRSAPDKALRFMSERKSLAPKHRGSRFTCLPCRSQSSDFDSPTASLIEEETWVEETVLLREDTLQLNTYCRLSSVRVFITAVITVESAVSYINTHFFVYLSNQMKRKAAVGGRDIGCGQESANQTVCTLNLIFWLCVLRTFLIHTF